MIGLGEQDWVLGCLRTLSTVWSWPRRELELCASSPNALLAAVEYRRRENSTVDLTDDHEIWVHVDDSSSQYARQGLAQNRWSATLSMTDRRGEGDQRLLFVISIDVFPIHLQDQGCIPMPLPFSN
jgi:hypothetical protein